MSSSSPQSIPPNRHVWVVSELYFPELTSTGYFLTGIAEGLAATHRVSVLCGQPSYWERGKLAPPFETRNGVEIWRSRGTLLDKNQTVSRLLNLITISAAIFFAALTRFRKDDTVIVVTNPPLLPYLVALACKARGARPLLLVHDVYPDVLFRLGMVSQKSVAARVMTSASHWLYRNMERVLVLGRDMRDLLLRTKGLSPARLVVATNWANTEEIWPVPAEETKLLQQLGLTGKFVVQFYGNMGRPHGIEDLVQLAELLRDETRFHLLLIGWGAKKAWTLNEVERRALKNVTIMDPLPREESCDVQNACHVAVNTLAQGMAGISVPSRTYNALAAGKPLIAVCEEGSELSRIVEEENIGWRIPPGRPDLLAEAVREAMADPQALRAMGERSRHACMRQYTHAHVISVYEAVLSDLESQQPF